MAVRLQVEDSGNFENLPYLSDFRGEIMDVATDPELEACCS